MIVTLAELFIGYTIVSQTSPYETSRLIPDMFWKTINRIWMHTIIVQKHAVLCLLCCLPLLDGMPKLFWGICAAKFLQGTNRCIQGKMAASKTLLIVNCKMQICVFGPHQMTYHKDPRTQRPKNTSTDKIAEGQMHLQSTLKWLITSVGRIK